MAAKIAFIAKVAQLVEHNLAKVRVAGSSPVFRSKFNTMYTTVVVIYNEHIARVAELVDALVSGASGVIAVQVRVLFRALLRSLFTSFAQVVKLVDTLL